MPCEVSVGPLATRAPLVLLPRVPFASLPALRSSSMMSMPSGQEKWVFRNPGERENVWRKPAFGI
jgi:hypothetical protein